MVGKQGRYVYKAALHMVSASERESECRMAIADTRPLIRLGANQLSEVRTGHASFLRSTRPCTCQRCLA